MIKISEEHRRKLSEAKKERDAIVAKYNYCKYAQCCETCDHYYTNKSFCSILKIEVSQHGICDEYLNL